MIRPEVLTQTLGAPRALSRMVRGAARAEIPFLRSFDSLYGYMLKDNMPAPKGPLTPANAFEPPSTQANPAPQPKKESPEDKNPDRPVGGSRPRNRSPRGARRSRGPRRGARRSRRRRRPAMCPNAGRLVEKRARDERLPARLAGEDSKGSLRDKCKNCYIGLGAPRHVGRSCQLLSNRRHLPCRAPGCEGSMVRHWPRDCPNY